MFKIANAFSIQSEVSFAVSGTLEKSHLRGIIIVFILVFIEIRNTILASSEYHESIWKCFKMTYLFYCIFFKHYGQELEGFIDKFLAYYGNRQN